MNSKYIVQLRTFKTLNVNILKFNVIYKLSVKKTTVLKVMKFLFEMDHNSWLVKFIFWGFFSSRNCFCVLNLSIWWSHLSLKSEKAIYTSQNKQVEILSKLETKSEAKCVKFYLNYFVCHQGSTNLFWILVSLP